MSTDSPSSSGCCMDFMSYNRHTSCVVGGSSLVSRLLSQLMGGSPCQVDHSSMAGLSACLRLSSAWDTVMLDCMALFEYRVCVALCRHLTHPRHLERDDGANIFFVAEG